jgi:hypothetical protein
MLDKNSFNLKVKNIHNNKVFNKNMRFLKGIFRKYLTLGLLQYVSLLVLSKNQTY